MTTLKEALEFYADPKNWRGGSILDMEASHFDGWTKAQQALASLQGEDAVERVARIKSLLASFHRNSCYPEAMTGELNDAAEHILATGLVPDEAAIRADEREKCAQIAKHVSDKWAEMGGSFSNITVEVIGDEIVAAMRVATKSGRRGIYIASKTKHADKWKQMRDEGVPIISTWIDEAGAGETSDFHDLWRRCLTESANCRVLVSYREPGEVLKGGWVEIGAALAKGVPVYAVGIEEFTIAGYRGITHFPTIEDAIAAAN